MGFLSGQQPSLEDFRSASSDGRELVFAQVGDQRINALAHYFELATLKEDFATESQRVGQRHVIEAPLSQGQRFAACLEGQFRKPEHPQYAAPQGVRG